MTNHLCSIPQSHRRRHRCMIQKRVLSSAARTPWMPLLFSSFSVPEYVSGTTFLLHSGSSNATLQKWCGAHCIRGDIRRHDTAHHILFLITSDSALSDAKIQIKIHSAKKNLHTTTNHHTRPLNTKNNTPPKPSEYRPKILLISSINNKPIQTTVQ